jgi:Ni,Fe-hydrogenase I large subunit
LAEPGGEAFAARPEWEGRAPETGPLVRMGDRPPVLAARAEAGNGLLTRSVARLAELAAVPAALRELADASGGPMIQGGAVTPGSGLGLVAAARGQLVHRVVLDGGTVSGYRILAPTEWNFHPRGCLVRGLEGARFPDDQAALDGAGYLIGGIDPCVDYTLELTHA